MKTTPIPSFSYPDSKPHYDILDGMRGVAAVMVVIFHVFETHATSHLDQIINHGYLAVDFFFLLSGYVIGYAYDEKWGKMTVGSFFKRRLIRLQPMVIIGMIVGAVLYYFQGGEYWSIINDTPVWKMLLIMVVGCTLLPLPPTMDIRGWNEMHPLNGPGWSLVFEYIANILYALFIRRFSNKALSVLVFIAGCVLIHFAVTNSNGDVIGGWSLSPTQLRTGFTRLMYPFFAGLLLSRVTKPTQIRHAFWLCTLLVIVILSIPRIGGSEHLWANGLYDSLSIILLFPLIVYLGASGRVTGRYTSAICKFFGDISYPIYITHYPLIYVYTAWVRNNKLTLQDAYPMAILVILASILLAYFCLKFYDLPIRNWLTKQFMNRKSA